MFWSPPEVMFVQHTHTHTHTHNLIVGPQGGGWWGGWGLKSTINHSTVREREEGRKEGKKEGRKEERKKGRKEGRGDWGLLRERKQWRDNREGEEWQECWWEMERGDKKIGERMPAGGRGRWEETVCIMGHCRDNSEVSKPVQHPSTARPSYI